MTKWVNDFLNYLKASVFKDPDNRQHITRICHVRKDYSMTPIALQSDYFQLDNLLDIWSCKQFSYIEFRLCSPLVLWIRKCDAICSDANCIVYVPFCRVCLTPIGKRVISTQQLALWDHKLSYHIVWYGTVRYGRYVLGFPGWTIPTTCVASTSMTWNSNAELHLLPQHVSSQDPRACLNP